VKKSRQGSKKKKSGVESSQTMALGLGAGFFCKQRRKKGKCQAPAWGFLGPWGGGHKGLGPG